MTQTNNATVKEIVYTPRGIISFPYYVKPDSGRQYSDDKYKGDLFIPMDVYKKEGKAMVDAILKVARAHFGRSDISMNDFKHPLKNCANDKEIPEALRNSIMVRAKSSFKPSIYLPNFKEGKPVEMTDEQARNIKGGDIVRHIICFYPYTQSGGGVAAGLQAVHFIKAGDPIGQGKAREISLLVDAGDTSDSMATIVEQNKGSADVFGFQTT